MEAIKRHTIRGNSIISLKKGKSRAVISLSNGGSLTELMLNGKILIKDFSEIINYDESYASSILFPFANRILNGEYEYENEVYQLNKNSIGNANAIHGLVYNKPFKVVERKCDSKSVSIVLLYTQETQQIGFPFLFSIEVTYTLYENDISIEIAVDNDDAKTFPFTIGWHPYFYTENLKNSLLEIDADEEIIHDEKMIPIEVQKNKRATSFKIGNQQLDNCYILNTNEVTFKTSNYKFKLNSSLDKSFIQIYTPELTNYIAIEPVSGPSNSFNNAIGLKYLQPKEVFNVKWTIQLEDE